MYKQNRVAQIHSFQGRSVLDFLSLHVVISLKLMASTVGCKGATVIFRKSPPNLFLVLMHLCMPSLQQHSTISCSDKGKKTTWKQGSAFNLLIIYTLKDEPRFGDFIKLCTAILHSYLTANWFPNSCRTRLCLQFPVCHSDNHIAFICNEVTCLHQTKIILL